MKNRLPKILLGASSILLSLSSCTNVISSSSREDKTSPFESSNSKSGDAQSSISEESSSDTSSSTDKPISSESQSSSDRPISSESSSDAPISKIATISFGVKTSNNISSSPTDASYSVSGISLKSVYFSNCFAPKRGTTDEDSNALRVGSGKKTGSVDINFEKATLVKRVNIYAKQFDGDPAVEYNLSSSANPTGMDITIESSEFTKFSYLYLDKENETKSTSISFKANQKGRIYVSKIEIVLYDDTIDDDSSSSPSSSSSSSQSSESSSSSEDSSSSSSSSPLEPDIDEDGYYQGVNWNATGATLKTSLFNVISKNTKNIGYDGLWTAYEKTDLTDEGYIWDMYSNEKFNPKTDRAGSYKGEGDVYNREHSIPQSKFAGTDSSKMKADIFHVYPTDGYVNNRRGNYPHGNVSNATYTSKNGSKLGTGSNNGYNGTVFEPIDEYKGDFARTYFYFVTRYQSSIPSMSYDSFSKNTYPSLSTWALKTYLAWNDLDPVSEKERNRNDAAYLIQNNRNPFIDHPEAVHRIWDNALS